MPVIDVLMREAAWDSPFIVPVAGCAMVLGIVVAGVVGKSRHRELQAQERMAAIARGVPVPPTPEELQIMHGRPTLDLRKRRANSRTAGIVLVFTGLGILLFFVALAAILSERNVLSGAAVALMPMLIGAGFLVDVRLQTRELAEVGGELGQLPAETT